MATNYRQVSPGQPVKFSAQRENDITALLNNMGYTGGSFAGAKASHRIAVYNNTDTELTKAQAVIFADGDIINGAVPVKAYVQGKDLWGVLTDDLSANSFGSAVVSGPVEVEISGGSGKFAAPASDGKTFTLGSTGAQVISHKDKKAIILLGGSGETIKLAKITSVPAVGYGAGTAKVIKGFNENGTPILEETEFPVMIPRI